jgi:hypothetical protein
MPRLIGQVNTLFSRHWHFAAQTNGETVMFDVGDIVVCVDARPKQGSVGAIIPIHDLLREGCTYIVTGITYAAEQVNRVSGECSTVYLPEGTISLAGIVPPPPMRGFSPYRFRKVDPIVTDEELSVTVEERVDA